MNSNQPLWTTRTSNTSNPPGMTNLSDRVMAVEEKFQQQQNDIMRHKAEAQAVEWVSKNEIQKLQQNFEELVKVLDQTQESLQALVEIVNKLVEAERKREEPMEEIDDEEYQRELADPNSIG